MILKKMYLLLFVAIILFSCSEHVLDKIARQKKAHEETRTGIIDSLASNYSIVYRWDTLDANYRRHLFTIDFNPIIGSVNQIIGESSITDIYAKDSINYVSINAGVYGSFYLDFPITESQLSQLIQKDKEFIFVVSVQKLEKIKFSVEGDIRDKENEDVELNLDNSESFLGSGKIIKIVSIDKLVNR